MNGRSHRSDLAESKPAAEAATPAVPEPAKKPETAPEEPVAAATKAEEPAKAEEAAPPVEEPAAKPEAAPEPAREEPAPKAKSAPEPAPEPEKASVVETVTVEKVEVVETPTAVSVSVEESTVTEVSQVHNILLISKCRTCNMTPRH